MKIEFHGRIRAISVAALFVAAACVGMLVEHARGDKFTVETLGSQPGKTVDGQVKPVETEAQEGSAVVDGKININTADVELLQQLNGIGESMAKRIVEYRESNGPFESVEELTLVTGIGEKKLEELRDMICAE